MEEAEFWTLIDSAERASASDKKSFLTIVASELNKLSDKDLIAFKNVTYQLIQRAYSRRLWLAFDFILRVHSSDDNFEYCIGGLFCLGKATFEKILMEPDSLAELSTFSPSEEFLYLAAYAWEKRHSDSHMPTEKRSPLILKDEPATEQEAEELDAKLPSIYPRLFAKYGLPKQLVYDPACDPYAM